MALAALLLWAFANTIAAPPLGAQDDASAGADVILVVDHSISMATSDPDEQRVAAALELIDAIAAFSDAFDVRIGGIEFGSPYGDSLRINLPLSDVDDPQVREQFQARELVGTDFHAALCLAWRVAVGMRPPEQAACPDDPPDAELGSVPVEDPNREKTIVLITDGGPAPRNVELAQPDGLARDCPANALSRISSTENERDYMCALVDSWSELTERSPVKLFVLGIDANDEWFSRTATHWHDMTRCEGDRECARQVSRVRDPAGIAGEIIRAATGQVTNLCTADGVVNHCLLPPGLRDVHFVITDIEPDHEITVKTPDGATVTPNGRARVRTVGETQRWRIVAPESGEWRIESSDEGPSAFSLMRPAQLQLRPETATPTTDAEIKLTASPLPGIDVDEDSLDQAPFMLELVHDERDEQPLNVRLRRDGDTFVVTSADGGDTIGRLRIGRWTVRLTRSVEDPVTGEADQLVIGNVTFDVSAPPPNTPPTASIDPSQVTAATADETVWLLGVGNDAETPTDELSFAWRQIGGTPRASILDSSSATASFTAPEVPEGAQLTFRVTVTDEEGLTDSAETTITINPPANTPPTASIHPSQVTAATAGETVPLRGVGNDAETPTGELSFAWTQVHGTPPASIFNSSSATAGFTAPNVPEDSRLTFRVTVTDEEGLSDSAETTITISPPPNAPPIASIDPSQVTAATAGETVPLRGVGNDAETPTGELSFAWTQISGTPLVPIFDSSSAIATFTAPEVAEDIRLAFQLTVTDADGQRARAETTITVSPPPNTPPTASIDPSQVTAATAGETVPLRGVGNDAETPTGELSFAWTQISGTPQATIFDSSSDTASFTTPALREVVRLTFRLTVADEEGSTATSDTTITISPPHCSAGSPRTVDFVPADSRIDAYRFGFTWDSRPRFRLPNSQAAVIRDGETCVPVVIDAQLLLSSVDESGPACPLCEGSVTGKPPQQVEAEVPVPEGTSAPYVREARVLADGDWHVVAREEITVEVPEWAALEPLLSLLATIAAVLLVLAAVSFVSVRILRHQLDPLDDDEPPRLIDIQCVRVDGMGAPIVRLGFFAWRRAEIHGAAGVSKGYVSLAGLVAGPPVVRFHSPSAEEDPVEAPQPEDESLHPATRARDVVWGARTLVVGRRLRYRSFEVGDGKESELELVRSLDAQGLV